METLNLGIDGLDDIEQIGAGGSSRVYRARQVELDRLVALKVLKAADDPEVTRQFDRERKAMGRLSLNEGIVPVYSSGITDHGEPYLIMPYYPNGSLQDRINTGPVPWQEAIGYVAAAAETMAAAHEADVVHLDLKPANVLLSSNGSPRIADFGIAKLVGDQTVPNTNGNAFTPTFSAPETLLGGTASPASDVYGLAATLWALIAGRPPFRAIDGEDNTLMAVVGRVVHQPPEDLRHLAPDPICSVIEIAMAKDASDRYPTAEAFRQALANAVRTVDLPPVPPAIPSGAADSPGAADSMASVGAAGGHDPSSANQTGTAQSSLRFEAVVPPRLVPAGTSRRAGIADAIDRYSGVAVGLGVAAVVLAAVFVGQRLLTDAGTASGSGDQLLETGLSTSSTVRSAEAGAGGLGGDDPAGASATSTPEATTTSSEAGPSTTATTSATTASTSGSTATEATTTTENSST
ncbi:MAG: serine/threonine protein kinase, partial [Acidimicrobiia bacterium]|nr:serine/threonine protein kinase [Acidimicrobiia bacterium]